jgi:Methyltransferase domain
MTEFQALAQDVEGSKSAQFTERKNCIACGASDLLELSSGTFDSGPLRTFIDEDPWGEDPRPFLVGRPWSFVECQHCSTRFHRFILTLLWNERRFEKWMSHEAIEAFERGIQPSDFAYQQGLQYSRHALQIQLLTEKIRNFERVAILDFGCGYGGFLSMCSSYGFDAYGVDRSTAKLENNKFSRVFSSIDEVRHKAPFHALTLFEVLEHLDDPRELLIELRGLLAVGGVLVIETPDCTGVKGIVTRDEYLKIHPLEHINAFTPNSLKVFVEGLGFSYVATPFSCVSDSETGTFKRLCKQGLRGLLKPTTQMYFLKK